MYGHSSFYVVNCRRRWRMAMMCIHGTLLALSLVLVLVMMIPIISRPASIQYFTMALFLFLTCCYSIFALVVYSHCRLLLRILSILTAALLLTIAFVFVLSFLTNIACKFDQNVLYTVNVTRGDCLRGSAQPNINSSRNSMLLVNANYAKVSSTPGGSFQCVYRYRYTSHCTPLPHFWSTMGEEESPGVRASIHPVGGVYALCALVVLLTTLWHTVDEVRFGRGSCVNCGNCAAHVAMACTLRSAVQQA